MKTNNIYHTQSILYASISSFSENQYKTVIHYQADAKSDTILITASDPRTIFTQSTFFHCYWQIIDKKWTEHVYIKQ